MDLRGVTGWRLGEGESNLESDSDPRIPTYLTLAPESESDSRVMVALSPNCSANFFVKKKYFCMEGKTKSSSKWFSMERGAQK